MTRRAAAGRLGAGVLPIVVLAGLCATGSPIWAAGAGCASDSVPARVVVGDVTDSAGAPIAGALVGVAASDPFASLQEQLPPPPADASAPSELGGQVMSARTDGTGHFRVASPPKSPFSRGADSGLTVTVLMAGYQPRITQLPADTGMATVHVTLAHGAWSSVPVRTVDGSGHAVAGASIATTWEALHADADGRAQVRVPAGEALNAVIRADGFRPSHLMLGDQRTVARSSPGADAAITLRLLHVITGTVRDVNGRPVAGAVVGIQEGGTFGGRFYMSFQGPREPRTDAAGEFIDRRRVSLAANGLPDRTEAHEQVAAADSAFSAMAVRALSAAELAAPVVHVDLTLRPTRLVRVPLAMGRTAETVTASYTVMSRAADSFRTTIVDGMILSDSRVAAARSTRSPGQPKVIEFRLPAGDYALGIRSMDAQDMARREIPFSVPAGAGPLTLPPVTLPKSPLRALIGKAAPELTATDLDGRPVQLTSYRGKVVVLDFWGTWCGPCVASLPTLSSIYTKYRDKGVIVLALHDATIRNRSEFETKFAPIRALRAYGGKDLPFPVLLDSPLSADDTLAIDDRPTGHGRTIATYHIAGFPSTFVIARDGTLVGQYEASDLDAVLPGVLKPDAHAARSGIPEAHAGYFP